MSIETQNVIVPCGTQFGGTGTKWLITNELGFEFAVFVICVIETLPLVRACIVAGLSLSEITDVL